MAERHDLKISISQNGEVQIEVDGVKGAKCLQITEDLEKELGLVLSREKKSEFYSNEINTGTDVKIEKK